MQYVCQHCFRNLGPVVDDEPVPHCPDHPDGVVVLADNTEADDVDSQPE